jgi:protein-S-isoprenylcysteine O-methyltransferase Ste14
METKDMYHSLKIRKKPWYTWLLRLIWLAWVIFWLEVALGSWKEVEPRAAIISVVILVVSLAIGILLWSWGRLKPKEES